MLVTDEWSICVGFLDAESARAVVSVRHLGRGCDGDRENEAGKVYHRDDLLEDDLRLKNC